MGSLKNDYVQYKCSNHDFIWLIDYYLYFHLLYKYNC